MKSHRLPTFLLLVFVAAATAMQGAYKVYFGTVTTRASRLSHGIYVADFDSDTGVLDNVRIAGFGVNPAFLAVDAQARRLYAISSMAEYEGKPMGAVNAYQIEADDRLMLINQQPSEGGNPAHIVMTPDRRHVIVSNYRGGNVVVFPIAPDGSLKPASQIVPLEGSSIHPQRQRESHPHQVVFSPDGKLVVATALGADRCYLFRFDPVRGKLRPAAQPYEMLPPGSGPRHVAFHPSLPMLYVVNELYSTVATLEVDTEAGTLTYKGYENGLPERFAFANTASEVVVHPSGKFVFSSNRGHDSIAIFSVDQATGLLTLVGHAATGGNSPRDFSCDPTGKWILVGNEASDSVAVFRINLETGQLETEGVPVPVPSPTSVQFLITDP